MRIAQITVSRSAKINVGNYESRDAFASLTVELEPGDNIQDTLQRAWATAQAEIHEQEQLIRDGDLTMPIKGLTTRAAGFPEIGHIRKGAPKGENRPGKDLDYFRVEFNDTDTNSPTRFKEIYGNEPRAIRIMLPYDDIDQCFDAWREAYSAGQLLHRCDGEVVHYPPSERGQPCLLKDHQDKKRRCKPVGRLRVILPELARLGYMTVHTTSVYDLKNISANLAAIKQLAGRLTGIPMVLRRVEKEISTPTKEGKRKRYKKWLLFIEVEQTWVEARLAGLQETALLEAGGTPMLASGEDDYIVDNDTGEIVEEPQATITTAIPIPHWSENEENLQKFTDFCINKGISKLEALFALGVDDIADYSNDPKTACGVVAWFGKHTDLLTRAVTMCDELIVSDGLEARVEEARAVIERSNLDLTNATPDEAVSALIKEWNESDGDNAKSVLDKHFPRDEHGQPVMFEEESQDMSYFED
jgi:hypothetical protein